MASTDSAMLEQLSERVLEVVKDSGGGGGRDLVVDLLRARFPTGARLAGDGGATFEPATMGAGWQLCGSWPEVMAAAGQAGRGGFVLVRPTVPDQGAVGVHVGPDATLLVIWVRPDGVRLFDRLSDSVANGLPVPAAVVVIDYCAEVRLPDLPG